MAKSISELVRALHKAAGWEDTSGAREQAVAIARIGGDEAVRALIGVLEKMAAVDLDGDAGDVSDECWRASSAATHGLERLGSAAVPALLALAAGPPTRARRYAALALGSTRAPEALGVLLALADAPDDRKAALEALGRLGLPAALPVLRAAATASDHHERATAARAIGALRHPQSVELLRALLADRSWYVRTDVCDALAQLGTAEARAALATAVTDVDHRVADRARAGLRQR